MKDTVTKALSNKVNLEILSLLSIGRFFPRELSRVLMRDETDISRRLRRLEDLGLVKSSWIRLGSKNVKVYELAVEELKITFRKGRLEIIVKNRVFQDRVEFFNPSSPPPYSKPVGRDFELELLKNTSSDIIHVWGPPGIGKTHLVAYYLNSYSNSPVFWYYASEEESLPLFLLRLGMFLSMLGYERLLQDNLVGAPETLLLSHVSEGLGKTGTILVVDDYHLAPRDLSRFIIKLLSKYTYTSIYLLSRHRERKLPYWKGRVLEINLKPLREEDIKQFTGNYHHSIWKYSKGIPSIIKLALRLVDEGVPSEEAARIAAKSYYEGLLPELGLSEEAESTLHIIALSQGWLDKTVICNASNLSPSKCKRILSYLREASLIDDNGEKVRIKEYLSKIDELIPLMEKKVLARKLALMLFSSSNCEDHIRALSVLSKACLTKEASQKVRERLLKGSSTFLCCPEFYSKTIRNLMKCGGTLKEAAYFSLEDAIITRLHLEGKVEEAINQIRKALPIIVSDKTLYTRLLLLLVNIYLKIGKYDEIWEKFQEATNLYNSLPEREKKIIRETMLATAAYVYFIRGELSLAIKSTLKEIEETVENEDPGNYAVARIHLAELYRYAGKYDDAIKIVEETINNEVLFPKGPPPEIEALASMPYGFSMIGMKKYRRAEEIFENAMKKSRGLNKFTLLFGLAITHYLLDNKNLAKKELEESGYIKTCSKPKIYDPDCKIVIELAKALDIPVEPGEYGGPNFPFVNQVSKMINR